MFRTLARVGIVLLAWGALPAPAQGAPTVVVQIAGEPTSDGAILQARLSRRGRARFQWVADGSAHVHSGAWLTAEADSDHVIRMGLRGLASGTLYRWRSQVEGAAPGRWSVFHTLYPPIRAETVSFAVVTGMNQQTFRHGKRFWFIETTPPAVQPDRRLGYRALETIAASKPFFVVVGGNAVYYDAGSEPGIDAASMRALWHEQLSMPHFGTLFARTGTYWMKNDHDFRFDAADRTGDRPPSAELGTRIFREQVPVARPEQPDAPGWRTHRVSADLQIWLLESRDHRDPNAMEDTAAKSLWGPEQLAWLKRTLPASTAAWRVVVTPTPLVGPGRRGRDDHTQVGGFRSEGDAFLGWAAETGLPAQGLVIITGGRRWQYHSIHPGGVHELSPGALHDQNLEPGVSPGSFRSTDPDGLIQQPFLEDDTGGFLWIEVQRDDAGSTLRATWFDEFGTARNRWEPPPRP